MIGRRTVWIWQYIRFTAVDKQGIAVDNFEGELSLSVLGEGQFIALDNGDHFTDTKF